LFRSRQRHYPVVQRSASGNSRFKTDSVWSPASATTSTSSAAARANPVVSLSSTTTRDRHPATLEIVATVYGSVVKAGIDRAPSIKVRVLIVR
jgi:hypothetical protein